MSKVIIAGAGAAGLMAAVTAAMYGHQVLLLEKNEKAGKKIYITGKGRCNLTNACSREVFFEHMTRNPKFLYSAFSSFSNEDVIAFMEEAGCPVKIERGERAFPVSDHASDVTAALLRKLKEYGGEIRYYSEVKKLLLSEDGENKKVIGVELTGGKKEFADAVILAMGGLSYPDTGSTGDGYRLAKQAGHRVTGCMPSLVPAETAEDWPRKLQGLALKNVAITLSAEEKTLYQGFGEMLFTHFGVSGPLLISASAYSAEYMQAKTPLKLVLDLKPALTEEELDKRLQKDFGENHKKAFRNALGGLFPQRMIPVMIDLSGIDPDKRVCDLTGAERRTFARTIKNVVLTVTGSRGFREAIITRGGVAVEEVKPATMESKLCEGLFMVGEMLDLDALTGGFNLQIAWSTGYQAGKSIPYV